MLHIATNFDSVTMSRANAEQESLALRLRQSRLEKGWSQEYLASRADTSQAVIQKIENAKSLRPRNIEAIADALDVHPAWLVFGVRETSEIDEEAVQVARAWSKLKDPERSTMRETINRLSEDNVFGA